MASEKSEKFRSLAEARTQKAIDAILRIGKLSNRQAYEWTQEDVRKIVKALKEAVGEVEARFEGPTTSAKQFKL